MEIQIIRDEVIFDALKEEWKIISEMSEAFIYQTFEWNRIWWNHFGKKGRLHLILFYSDSNLVGIAPLFWDTIQLSGKTIYAALRFIGSDVSQPEGEAMIGLGSYSDYLDLIVMPGYEKQVAKELSDFLFVENLSHDQIILDEVQNSSIVMQHLIPALNESGVSIEIGNSSTCTSITLDTSWELYLNRLSRNSRKKTKKYLNELNDETETFFKLRSIDNENELNSAFENLVCLHQKQWNSRGFPGTFYEKRMLDFTRDICSEFYKNKWLMIENLMSVNDGDRTINIEMYFTYKGRVYSVHGGTDPDSSYVNKGAGNITFTKVLKKSIEDGYKVFDYLRGMENYKMRRVDQLHFNKTIRIGNSRSRKSLLTPLVRHNVKILRRARVEAIQFGLIFKNRNLRDGLQAYRSFISKRLSSKTYENSDLVI